MARRRGFFFLFFLICLFFKSHVISIRSEKISNKLEAIHELCCEINKWSSIKSFHERYRFRSMHSLENEFNNVVQSKQTDIRMKWIVDDNSTKSLNKYDDKKKKKHSISDVQVMRHFNSLWIRIRLVSIGFDCMQHFNAGNKIVMLAIETLGAGIR